MELGDAQREGNIDRMSWRPPFITKSMINIGDMEPLLISESSKPSSLDYMDSLPNQVLHNMLEQLKSQV